MNDSKSSDRVVEPNTALRFVTIGSSLGGLVALRTLLSGLPEGFPAAIAIAQHRHPDSEPQLVELLAEACALPVCEPDDKEQVRAGTVYLAPPDYHLLVEEGSFALSLDPPVSYARPSADVLFESAAEAFGSRTIGVVLTGSSADGAVGAAQVRRRGGIVIVEDPDTAYSGIAPRTVLDTGGADFVVPLAAIASRLVELCRESRN